MSSPRTVRHRTPDGKLRRYVSVHSVVAAKFATSRCLMEIHISVTSGTVYDEEKALPFERRFSHRRGNHCPDGPPSVRNNVARTQINWLNAQLRHWHARLFFRRRAEILDQVKEIFFRNRRF